MRKLSFILISLLIGIGFALISFELFLRTYPKYGLKYNFNQFVIKDTKNPIIEVLNRKRNYYIYRSSDILGYERIPDSTAGINSFGLIGREYKLEKDKLTYRILVLGDSITEHTWYVQSLENLLNNSNPKLDYNFELWNAGVGGYSVNQYAAYLKHKGLRYNPDMLIIGLCLDDFYISHYVFYKDKNGFTACHNPARELSKKIPLNNFLFRHFYLYRFLTLKIDNLLSNLQTKSDSEGIYYLKMIKDICQKNKISLLAVVFSYLKPLNQYSNLEMQNYKEIIKALEVLNIDYIDLHKYFPEENGYALRMYDDDYVHPSSEGHRIAARVIYEYFIKNYFTPSYSERPKDIKN